MRGREGWIIRLTFINHVLEALNLSIGERNSAVVGLSFPAEATLLSPLAATLSLHAATLPSIILGLAVGVCSGCWRTVARNLCGFSIITEIYSGVYLPASDILGVGTRRSAYLVLLGRNGNT